MTATIQSMPGPGADSATVPVGYKRTDAGVIPEAWAVSSVGDEFYIQLGKMLDAARNTGVAKPYIGNRAVQWGRIELTHIGTVPMTPLDLQRFRLRNGDLLVCEGGAIGRAAMWSDQTPECYYQKSLHRLRPKRSYDPRLMMHYLSLWSFTRTLNRYVTQTSIAHLPKDRLEGAPLPVPTRPERRAISDVLSDVDLLLGALDALIAKKRAIKLAAMQQLLTGKTRLSGLSGKWTARRLGDHVTFLRTGSNSRSELGSEGAVKYLHYGDIHALEHVRLDPQSVAMPHLPAVRARTLDRLRDGDVVFVDASEDLNGVGKSVEIARSSDVEVVAGLHTIAGRFDKEVLADGFKGYVQFHPAFRNHLRRLAAGTKVYATNRKHIASVEIRLPGVKEQTAIASVLSDMDGAIAALERRRDKTRAIKLGMMQQLLTGRVRLVDAGPEVSSG